MTDIRSLSSQVTRHHLPKAIIPFLPDNPFTVSQRAERFDAPDLVLAAIRTAADDLHTAYLIISSN
jgi:hypothetical protein